MCLLVLAWRAHPRYRLVVAANRDEFHERPAAALARWPAPADILAGRDLRAGGTWLGLDRQRRFGVVTNFRDLQRPQPGAPSRGELIPRFLAAAQGPGEFLASLQPQAASYSGFNLLLAEQDSLWYGSNRATTFARPLAPGLERAGGRRRARSQQPARHGGQAQREAQCGLTVAPHAGARPMKMAETAERDAHTGSRDPKRHGVKEWFRLPVRRVGLQ